MERNNLNAKTTYPVIIIGGGPAGMAAAIQLQRSGIQPVIFEQNQLGGLLNNAFCVENYLGFPIGIKGTKLVDSFIEQLNQWEIPVIYDSVTTLNVIVNHHSHQPVRFQVSTPNQVYTCNFLVLATGTLPKPIPISVPDEIQSHVLSEIYAIRHIKHKTIVIVGAGDAAFDYALQLASQNNVFILNRTSAIKALPLLVNRVNQISAITYLDHREIIEIKSSAQSLKPVTLVIRTPSQQDTLSCDFLIYAIGRDPNLTLITAKFTKQLKSLEQQHLFHYIGDVKNGKYRQTAIAIGDGIKVAMNISKQRQT